MKESVNRVGDKFGRLTIIEFIDRDQQGNARWKCRCECGKETVVLIANLLSGSTRSCGCLRREIASIPNPKRYRTTEKEYVVNLMWCSYRQGAIGRNLEFTLTKEDIWRLITSPCYWGNCQPIERWVARGGGNRKVFMAVNGIDRLDNTKGYTKENSVPCCRDHNYMKKAYSTDDFIRLCKQVYENHCK